jgi:hypothetical protein
MITFGKAIDYKRWIINDSIVITYHWNQGILEIFPRGSLRSDLRDLPIYYDRDVRDLVVNIFEAKKIVKMI